MKTIKVSLLKKLEMEVENYVKSGGFTDEAEMLRVAIRNRKLECMW